MARVNTLARIRAEYKRFERLLFGIREQRFYFEFNRQHRSNFWKGINAFEWAPTTTCRRTPPTM